ncbi:beta-ketoacyl-ACP synthase III [Thioclava sp. SK-1]|uniref:beta-ketoacyl-ACP synthase III n=1 Tax=Thioclava sp. SK-1 TaxID=1889770 RepID=UPI00082677DC|nr:beta-ketoacyl-ACP synthase III [Thioclava sp. SK-1]OCX66711.1 beta-ketoacyl-ACP synthase III [Thioclava sp. SK-1]
MHRPALTGSGVFTPADTITNDELVTSFNAYVERFNTDNAAEITAGRATALQPSSSEFIHKASGIEQRYVMDKAGVLDPARMYPRLDQRGDDQPSIMAEMSLDAANKALLQAGRRGAEVDLIICAASNMERAYPAISIEVQQLLGATGFAFDMQVACSSATFGIQAAADMIRSGSARRALVISPEITSGHLEWRDRDCHFIFGDVCTAVLIEPLDTAMGRGFEIVSTKCATQYSNNIRNNEGYLRKTRPDGLADRRDMQFMQNGRRVFKEVLPMVCDHILTHLSDSELSASQIKRLWLHQANKTMNDFIGRKVLGRDPLPGEQPNILQDYANTSSAGSIIAFDAFHADLQAGDLGLICSFGAGYSVGSVITRAF